MTERHSVREGCEQAVNEVQQVIGAIDWQPWEALPELLRSAGSVFVVGNGRSGFVLRMVAMRLMHAGLRVYVVGETTTPAISAGDVLIAVSGSGSTSGVVYAAGKAAGAGATVVAVTANAGSELAELATTVLAIPAPEKTDHDEGRGSRQYAGSLFEQATLFAFEGLFHALWQESGEDAAAMYRRHADLG